MSSIVSLVRVRHFAWSSWMPFTDRAFRWVLVVLLLVAAAFTLAPESNAQEVRVDATPSRATTIQSAVCAGHYR
jgi:hypothetical protein